MYRFFAVLLSVVFFIGLFLLGLWLAYSQVVVSTQFVPQTGCAQRVTLAGDVINVCR